jgi:O-antigen/teichoic acid export membrane protein
LSVVSWTIFALQDSVLIGLRATKWVPVENILYAVAKLALLPAFVAVSVGGGIFFAWILPVLVANFIVNWYIFKHFIPAHEATNAANGSLPRLRELVPMLAAQYATQLVTVLSNSIVTLVVVVRLGVVANARYYMPATIAFGAPLLIWSIYRSFLVEASAEPWAIRHHARVALWSSLAILVPTVVIGYILAPYILGIFGPTYATHGTALLRILLLSLPGATILAFYTSFAWLDRRLWQMTIREIASAAVFFILVFSLIGSHGIMAIGIATFVRSLIEGVLFLPLLIRRYRRVFV